MRRTMLALATAALAVTVTAGCGAIDKAIDCVNTADAIGSSVSNLGKAVNNATDNPAQADQALDDIDKELSSLKNKTDNADLSKAVGDLDKAVDNVRTAIKNGDNTPDISGVTDAAKEVGKVCTP
ncbi:hypothetical protein DWB77_04802 [Streptomyces hundungensis]|uniref:Secreted protein n=1 Tax=Streptomyces hundungensis TaxID=1077946 RepID=A0A387HNY9_9ACTN|nr:hypothetical protein [Streptomyces hundungensis]AYG82620.1 hypothetical protein DWB77_04802 [Streptomyces hundungensis]